MPSTTLRQDATAARLISRQRVRAGNANICGEASFSMNSLKHNGEWNGNENAWELSLRLLSYPLSIFHYQLFLFHSVENLTDLPSVKFSDSRR
jgi:hypothetical protein